MTTYDPDLKNVFQTLADSLAGAGIVEVLTGLVEACTSLTSAAEGGIVLSDKDGVLHVVASSSERTAAVEQAQLGTEQGPCLDCVQTGEPVEVPDLTQKHDDWPDFAEIAEDRGFRAVHATPMRLRDNTLGSLCLFSAKAGALSDRDATLVQTLADAATLSILQQHALDQSHALADQLQHALDSRIVIEQAKGALAQRMNIAPDEAFRLLRQQSRNSGRRLHDIAAEVVKPADRS